MSAHMTSGVVKLTSVKLTEVKFQTAVSFNVNSKCPQRNKVAQNY